MGEPLQDIRHILYREHHAAQQHDRKHQGDTADQHSRLLGIGYRGDQQAQAEGYDRVQDGHGNQQQQAAFYRNVQQEIG